MEFRVLGPLGVRSDGQAIGLGSRKQRLVLASLLAAPGHQRTVDQLIDDVWPDRPPKEPLSSLYAYISRLRRLLGPTSDDGQRIERVGDRYQLVVAPSEIDAGLFEQEVASARARQDACDEALAIVESALDRWRGEPFADADGAEFAVGPSAALWAQWREAVELQVDLLSSAGFDARAIAAARSLAGRDPLDEHAQALVMLTLYRAGRQSDALRHYHTTRQLLVDELGVEPTAELRDLERHILHHHPDLRVGTEMGPPVAATAAVAAALVGRRAEFSALVRSVERHDGPAHTVVVSGEPGIGKTRLLREVAERARTDGHWVIWVQAERGPRGTALLPVALAVADLANDLTPEQFAEVVGPDPTALAPLLASGGLPAGGSEPIDVGDDLARYRMEEAVRRNLRRLARLGPVLVVIDDLQWASEAMLELLIRLTTHKDTWPVTFIVATRLHVSGEVSAGLQALRHAASFEALDLEGLTQAEIGNLAVSMLGEVGGSIGAEVWRRTNGNPLFAAELLRSLDPADPVRSLAEPSTPASVAEAVLAHLAELPSKTEELLTVASLMGPTFEPALCAEIVGLPDQAPELLEPARVAGLVIEAPGAASRCAFRHDLVQAAITARLSQIRRVQLHAQIGRALMARHRHRQPGDVSSDSPTRSYSLGLLADHLCAGAAFGTGLDGARIAGDAAQAALDRHDAAEARRLATQGLHALSHAPATDDAIRIEATLLCDHAEALQRAFDNDRAHDAARKAFSVAIENGIVDAAIRAIRIFSGQNAGAWLGFWSHSDETVDMADRILTVVGDVDRLEPQAAIALIGPHAEALADLGDFERADDLTARALAIANDLGDPALIALAAERRLAHVDITPSVGERPQLCAEILSAAKIDWHYGPSARRHLMSHHLEQGDVEGAERELRRMGDLARRTDSDLVAFQVAFCRTSLDLLLGRLDAAAVQIDANRRLFAYFDRTRLDVLDIQQLWLVYEQGLLPFAEDAIRSRLALHETHSWKAPLMILLIEDDRPDEARAILDAMSPAEFQRVFESALQFMTPTLLAETVVVLEDHERAHWLLGVLEPVAHRLASFYGGTLYLGWASLPVGRLLGLVGRHDDGARHLDESLRRAEGLGSPTFALRARVAKAELDIRRGRDPSPALDELAGEAANAGFLGIANWCRRLDR